MNCVICDKELEGVQDNELQPYGGGQIDLSFCYGSCEFDLNSGETRFVGVICDGCSLKLVRNMKRQDIPMEDHHNPLDHKQEEW